MDEPVTAHDRESARAALAAIAEANAIATRHEGCTIGYRWSEERLEVRGPARVRAKRALGERFLAVAATMGAIAERIGAPAAFGLGIDPGAGRPCLACDDMMRARMVFGNGFRRLAEHVLGEAAWTDPTPWHLRPVAQVPRTPISASEGPSGLEARTMRLILETARAADGEREQVWRTIDKRLTTLGMGLVAFEDTNAPLFDNDTWTNWRHIGVRPASPPR